MTAAAAHDNRYASRTQACGCRSPTRTAAGLPLVGLAPVDGPEAARQPVRVIRSKSGCRTGALSRGIPTPVPPGRGTGRRSCRRPDAQVGQGRRRVARPADGTSPDRLTETSQSHALAGLRFAHLRGGRPEDRRRGCWRQWIKTSSPVIVSADGKRARGSTAQSRVVAPESRPRVCQVVRRPVTLVQTVQFRWCRGHGWFASVSPLKHCVSRPLRRPGFTRLMSSGCVHIA